MERPAQELRCRIPPIGEDGNDGGLAVCAPTHFHALATTLADTRGPRGADTDNDLDASSLRGESACASRGPNDDSRRAAPGASAGRGVGRDAADLLKSEKTQKSVLHRGEGLLGLFIDGSRLGRLRRAADDAGNSLFNLVVTLYVAALDRSLPCGNGELILLPSDDSVGCDEANEGRDIRAGGACGDGGKSDGRSRRAVGSAADRAKTPRRAGGAPHAAELPHSMQIAIAGSRDSGCDELARSAAGVALDEGGRVLQNTALRYILCCSLDARSHSPPSKAASHARFSMLTEVRESQDGLWVDCCFRKAWRSEESLAAIAEEFLRAICRAAGIA